MEHRSLECPEGQLVGIMAKCPVIDCPNSTKHFEGDRGVRVHISHKHPLLSTWLKNNGKTTPFLLKAMAASMVPSHLMHHHLEEPHPLISQDHPNNNNQTTNSLIVEALPTSQQLYSSPHSQLPLPQHTHNSDEVVNTSRMSTLVDDNNEDDVEF